MLWGRPLHPHFIADATEAGSIQLVSMRVGQGHLIYVGSEPDAGERPRAPLPGFSWPGQQQAGNLRAGAARATTGWATEGTQSEDTTEVHLQTLWPRCGRRETTAAHISAAWASPGQEAELAVAGVARNLGGGQGSAKVAHRKPELASGLAT